MPAQLKIRCERNFAADYGAFVRGGRRNFKI